MTVFWAALFSICITNTISNYKMTYPAAGPRPCAFSSTESWAALKPLTEAEEQMRILLRGTALFTLLWEMPNKQGSGNRTGKAGQSPHQVSGRSSDGALTSPTSWSKPCFLQAMRGPARWSIGGPLAPVPPAQCLRARCTRQPRRQCPIVEGCREAPLLLGHQLELWAAEGSICSKPLVCKLP